MLAKGALRWPVGLFQLRFPPWLQPLATQLVDNLVFLNNFLLRYSKVAYSQVGFSKHYLHNSQLAKSNADNENYSQCISQRLAFRKLGVV